MSRRVAEWMGFKAVTETYGKREVVLIPEDDDDEESELVEFNPIHSDADAFAVYAKLGTLGWLEYKIGYTLSVFAISGHIHSKTIVTDDATLRKAVVEIAEQVCKEGA